jgi:hypothetical protein
MLKKANDLVMRNRKEVKRYAERKRSRKRFHQERICASGIWNLRIWRIWSVRSLLFSGRARQFIPILPELPVASAGVVGDALCGSILGNPSLCGSISVSTAGSVFIGSALFVTVRGAGPGLIGRLRPRNVGPGKSPDGSRAGRIPSGATEVDPE